MGNRQIRGNEADRIDHDDQSNERGNEKFERHVCDAGYAFTAALAREKHIRRGPANGM
jgi:hypothetical protein